jgi:hypothetical protein
MVNGANVEQRDRVNRPSNLEWQRLLNLAELVRKGFEARLDLFIIRYECGVGARVLFESAEKRDRLQLFPSDLIAFWRDWFGRPVFYFGTKVTCGTAPGALAVTKRRSRWL